MNKAAKRHCLKCVGFGEHKTHKLGAVVSRAGKIISAGWNKNKTHPKSTDSYKILHAEMDAIIKAKGQTKGATLHVARIHKDGTLANARPCPACMALILAAEIGEVFYTDNDQWMSVKL